MQSNTTINICITKRCFYIASLNKTCFGRYIGHHQVVHSLILRQTIQYTIFFVFVNKILYTSIKSAFKITTVAVELKTYSEIKDIKSIKTGGAVGGGGS